MTAHLSESGKKNKMPYHTPSPHLLGEVKIGSSGGTKVFWRVPVPGRLLSAESSFVSLLHLLSFLEGGCFRTEAAVGYGLVRQTFTILEVLAILFDLSQVPFILDWLSLCLSS